MSTIKPLIKTPIGYYGGKQAIVHHLLAMTPEHDVYTEVYFGGGTLFFAKKPAKNETINDRLDIVINFYRVLKTDFKRLHQEIDATLYSRSDHKRAKTIIRSKDNHGPLELAWAFFVASNASFAFKLDGGIRYSNDMGSCPALTFQRRKENFIELLSKRLEATHIENNEALTILKSRNVKKAFHYLDPPYPNADQGHYKGYTWSEYKALLKWCGYECKGLFLLSNYNSRMLDVAIKKFGWHKKEITHRIKAPRKSGTAKIEVLVSNYKSPCQTLNLF